MQAQLPRSKRLDFQDETTKVNYVLSYLKGSALDCFEPGLLDLIEPTWCSNFDLFSEELEANFGTFNPVGEAEAELKGLCMQENHQATKYFIKFTQLSSRVYWGKAALLQQAYNGLAKRIKNEMVHHDKPTTLSGLWKLVQAIDAHYWERKAEIACETPAANSSGNKSEKNDNNKLSSDKGKGSSQSKQKNNNNSSSSSNQNKGNSSEPKKMSTPDYTSKLGKDGKLTPQERQHHINKNLCLCCGTSSHWATDCPKGQAAAKARTSKTTPVMQESTLTPKHCCLEVKKD